MTCAKTTADRILMLNEGVIIAEGSYEELEKSEDKWIRSFFIKYYLCKRNLS
jgi:phospholipid/cholesterol/gamma-HCH transport system ATP-binding protein